MQRAIRFRLFGKFGHFSRADTQTTVLSYPVPPRTVLLGIIAAIIGLKKDEAPVLLEPAHIAIRGFSLRSHWHTAKLRKDPPSAIPLVVKAKQKAENSAPEKASLIKQEWLWQPEYTVWVNLPFPFHQDLLDRLMQRRWHFSPSLGLSELSADIDQIGDYEATPLVRGTYPIVSVVRDRGITIDVNDVLERGLGLHLFSLPRAVTTDRVFSHERYVAESSGVYIRAETDRAYQIDGQAVVFL